MNHLEHINNKMIEIMPDSISYNIRAELNPLGNISSGNDFMYFDRTIKANIYVEIPLKLNASNLVFEDITDFSFSEEVIGGALNIYIENMFPFDFDVQFYVLDSQEDIVDSLISGTTLINAAVPINEVVKNSTLSTLKIQLDDKLISELKNSNKILIRFKVNSGTSNIYKLYDHYNIDVKVVGDFVYEM